VAVPLALSVTAGNFGCTFFSGAFFYRFQPFPTKKGSPFEERFQAALQLLDAVPLVDGHNDLPWNVRKFMHNQINDFR